MKKLILISLLIVLTTNFVFTQVAVNSDGSAANNSAMLDVKSNSKGLLPPRMTRAELNAIPSPAEGLIVYCTDCGLNGLGALSLFMVGKWYTLSINTPIPMSPDAGTHIASDTQIVWNWNVAPDATGYKWNTSIDYNTAADMGLATTKTETGLTCGINCTRYVWAYNSSGSSTPLVLTQATIRCIYPPIILSTISPYAVTSTTAISGAQISNDGGAPVTARGVCWSTTGITPHIGLTTKTSDGSGIGVFTSSITGLTPQTFYYVRAYATNSAGTRYGDIEDFKTTAPEPPVINDQDGNVYHPDTIGSQIWMVENLKTTKYRNGDPIPGETDNLLWNALSTGAQCSYANDVNNSTTYGRLYNWYAVNDPRNLAPAGWHIPTDADWKILTDYLTNNGYGYGGNGSEIGKSMASKSGWSLYGTLGTIGNDPATNNSSGFTGLPGGSRLTNGAFSGITNHGLWWSSSENLTIDAWVRYLSYGGGSFGNPSYNKHFGLSVRCIKDGVPYLISSTVSSIEKTSATSGGNVIGNGGGIVTERGVCWSTTPAPTIALSTKTSDGSGIGLFSSSITGLTAKTTYYIRAYATNGEGTGYGNEVNFTTLATVPSITTTAVSAIKTTTSTSGGNITSDGGAAVIARGVCWSISHDPTTAGNKTTDSNDAGSFTSNLSGLLANTTYYVRAYAINSAGTGYGDEVSFKSYAADTGTFTDIDNNSYKFVTIGTQVWMAENLKTTKYKDGTAIPLVIDTWHLISTPAYCWYNNDATTNKSTYGALYNWYTINTGNLCPTGWHLPSEAEWTTLTTYLGGEIVAGGKLKETGTSHWMIPNTEATNETGFAAVPSGYRSYFDGNFDTMRYCANWWSSPEDPGTIDFRWHEVESLSGTLKSLTQRYGPMRKYGFSVRCLRD